MTRLVVVACLMLSGCGGEAPENAHDALDAELTRDLSDNAADPVVMAALHDPIMVDPALTQRANDNAVRPPPQPFSGALPDPGIAAGQTARPETEKLLRAPDPLERADTAARQAITLDALAARRPGNAANCASRLRYSAGWARRLPADLPLYPDARVTEAAGAQGNGCALRVVSFRAGQPMRTMIDWYFTRARRAGYSATHEVDTGTHMLGGTRRDGAAYVLFLTETPGGTSIDMVVNNGV